MALNFLPRIGAGGRPILTLNRIEQPSVIRPSLPSNKPNSLSEKLTETQLMELDLYVASRAHIEQQRRAGLSGRISKHEADKQLRAAFRQPNALARRQKGGAA